MLSRGGRLIKSIFCGPLKLVALGAEAALYRTCFEGLDALVKIRLPKPYRDSRLDKALRVKRTELEGKIIAELRLKGLNVPALYYVSLDRALLIMEFIEGFTLRDIVFKEGIQATKYFRDWGVFTALMHEAGIVHGDLTTSNVIVKNDEIYVIDFGLAKYSSKVEDRATDIHLMIRAIESTHYAIKEALLRAFSEGYKEVLGDQTFKELLEKVKEIRMRGRYVEERRMRKNV